MSEHHLTREELKEGAKVRVLGTVPRRDSAITGTIQSWRESRFGGVFVEVATVVSIAELHNSYCGCAECLNHATRAKRRPMVLTYAMTDLVLA